MNDAEAADKDVQAGLYKVESTDNGQHRYIVSDKWGNKKAIHGNEIRAVVTNKEPFRTKEQARLADIPDPLLREPMFQDTVHTLPTTPQNQHIANVKARSRTQRGAQEVLDLEKHPREEKITNEMLDNQMMDNDVALSLKLIRPAMAERTRSHSKAIKLPMDQLKQAIAGDQVKDKIYEFEQMGFAGQWGAQDMYKAIEKKMAKNEQNPKVKYGQPESRPKHVSDDVAMHSMISNLRVQRVQKGDPYLHQDIPGETSGKLLKNNEKKQEPKLKRRMFLSKK
jgi:hypothetical protein